MRADSRQEKHPQEDATHRWQERVLAATGTGIVVTDPAQPDNPIIYCNPAFERITGYPAAEVIGRNCRFLQGQDTDPAALAEIRAAVQERRECRVTLKNYRKDGTAFWNDLIISPVYDDRGRLLNFIGVQNDITDRIQAQNNLAGAEGELERAHSALQESERRTRTFLRDVLASVSEGRLRLCDSEQDLPAPFPDCGRTVILTHPSLRVLRYETQKAAVDAGVPEDRWQDLVTAVAEAAMNAVVHGGGGEARVCAGPQGTIQVWIQDHGRGIGIDHLHRATLERGYTTTGTLGHGFWLMLQTVDRIWLLTGVTGTTLVLEQDREQPQPAWFRSVPAGSGEGFPGR